MIQNYQYRARNASNQVVTGIVQAASADAAKKILLKNQLTPITIAVPHNFFDWTPFVHHVGLKDKTLLARQLATMIEAGLTLSQAMHLLIRQTKKGRFHEMLEAIHNDIQDGFSFSTALAKYPDVFDPIFISVVRSGEATGKLETVLQQLATNLEKDVKLRNKVKSVMIYPAFIICAMIGVATLMMVKVIPQLRDVFDQSQQQLPVATRALIAISDLMTHHGWWLILGVIVLIFALRYFFRTESGSYLYSKFSLKVPVFGSIIEESTMARLGRMLEILLGSGVPMLEALRLIRASFPNRLHQAGISEVISEVERGVPMSSPISDNPIFPYMVAQMVSVGEQTGKMDEVMGRMANYYEDEVETKVAAMSSLIEPIVIILLGAGVLFLVVAILLPIYQISTSV